MCRDVFLWKGDTRKVMCKRLVMAMTTRVSKHGIWPKRLTSVWLSSSDVREAMTIGHIYSLLNLE
jgi:hypothetical protein